MVLSNIPKLKINNIELEILYLIWEGKCGITLALTTKNNPTNYPLLICKFFRNSQYCSNPKNKIYNELTKYNITPKLIGIQKTQDNFKYEYINIDGLKVKEIFKNNIYYYEIGGICNLSQYLLLLKENKYNNIEYLKNYVNIIINNITNININSNILHHDLICDNIMIKNKYTLYLFNIFNLYLKEKNDIKKKKLLKELNKYLFNTTNLNKKLTDDNLLKDNELYKSKIITMNNKHNISFIDFDFAININDTFKSLINKYNLNNNMVKYSIQLIYNIWFKCDLLNVLFELIEKIHIDYSFNNFSNNITDILRYIENKYKSIITDIINNTFLLKNINNNIIAYNVINNVLTMIYNINNKSFDNLFKYIYTNQYLKDNDYLYYNYEHCKYIANKYLKDNTIILNENSKKHIYKK